jgi:hypothetical protein
LTIKADFKNWIFSRIEIIARMESELAAAKLNLDEERAKMETVLAELAHCKRLLNPPVPRYDLYPSYSAALAACQNTLVLTSAQN